MQTRDVFRTVLLCAILSAQFAYAARVAVVIDLPDGTLTKCVAVSDEMNGYDIMQEASQENTWSYYGPALGHGLCAIGGVGCPASNCYCDQSAYWNFYVKEAGGSWSYSSVGFDGGTSCRDHYCASDGDILGFAYGSYGTAPEEYSFDEICCEISGDSAPCGQIELAEVVAHIYAWANGRAALGEIVNLINAWSTSA